MRSRYVPAVLVAAACALASACGTVAAPGGPPAGSGQAGTSTTLEISGFEYPYTDAVVEEFRKRHPGITVEYSVGELSFEDGSVQTLLRSGQAPDVLLVNSGPGRVGLLAEAGLIAPLDYERHGLAERYQPAVLDQITRQGGGTPYEVVEGLDIFQVYVNEGLLAKAGVRAPTTFDELVATCGPLAASGVRPIVAGVRNNFAGGWLLGALVQASAGTKAMEEVIYGEGAFDQPSIVRGGTMLRDLITAGCIDAGQAAALDQEQAQAAFLNGEAAMSVLPQGALAERRAEGGDVSGFGAFPMPTPDAGAPAVPTAGLAHSWVLATGSDATDAAYAWFEWVSSPDYLKLAVANGMTLAPATVVPADVTLDPAVQDAVGELAKGAGYNPSVYLPAPVKDAWYQAVQGIITGSATPEAAMAQVQAALVESRAGAGG